jgi:hypothetical protein
MPPKAYDPAERERLIGALRSGLQMKPARD